MQLFHYHLATSRVREHEERYRQLGFRLVARYGTIAGRPHAAGSDQGWPELERSGFRHRLTELEHDGVNVVVQPGRWEPPLVDHVGVLASAAERELVLARGQEAGLRVQEREGRRTFVATGAGYRLELRTDLVSPVADFDVTLATDDPDGASAALAALLGVDAHGRAVRIGSGTVRFVAGGPSGRPRFAGERVGARA